MNSLPLPIILLIRNLKEMLLRESESLTLRVAFWRKDIIDNISNKSCWLVDLITKMFGFDKSLFS